MNLNEVRQDGAWICYRTDSVADAMKLRYEFQPGNYDLEKHKEKRSRNANNYAWELISKLSNKMRLNPVDVYRDSIKGISGRSKILWCPSDAVEDLKKAWVGDHIGRDLKVIDDDGQNATVLAEYGSSDYDREQMAILIDHLVQDCSALGIDTKDPNDIESLLDSWNGRN